MRWYVCRFYDVAPLKKTAKKVYGNVIFCSGLLVKLVAGSFESYMYDCNNNFRPTVIIFMLVFLRLQHR